MSVKAISVLVGVLISGTLIFSSCQNLLKNKYTLEMSNFRDEFKNDLVTGERNPLTREDLVNVDFYDPNRKYKVKAEVYILNESDTLTMKTSAGRYKDYLPYAALRFSMDGYAQQLIAYTSLELKNKAIYEDYLFVPFTDATNGMYTYGGGRYLNLSKNDIKNKKLTVDFNKAYNPWCAYSEGYNCPIPPPENDLQIEIPAGEKKYRGQVKKLKKP